MDTPKQQLHMYNSFEKDIKTGIPDLLHLIKKGRRGRDIPGMGNKPPVILIKTGRNTVIHISERIRFHTRHPGHWERTL